MFMQHLYLYAVLFGRYTIKHAVVFLQDQAQTMCEDQFKDVALFEGVPTFDNAVVNVSQEIIDDYPASDPRWAEAVPSGELPNGSQLSLYTKKHRPAACSIRFFVFVIQKLSLT